MEENNNEEEKNIYTSEYLKRREMIMQLLFIITILSLFGAMYVQGLLASNTHGFNFTKTMWSFWLWLPIPVISIILGFKYKEKGLQCTKNIVAGFIIGFFLLGYGSFYFFPTFDVEYERIYNYKEIINVELPEYGEMTIVSYDTYFDENIKNFEKIDVYYNQENTNELERNIKVSENWILCKNLKSTLNIFVPISMIKDDNSYISIYNKTLDEYNELPNKTGTYEIYTMLFNKEDKHLEINKFEYDYKK